MAEYKCALIGCGRMGSQYKVNAELIGLYTHSESYEACERTKLMAACDPDAAQLEAFKKNHPEIETFDSVGALLAAGDWDIVSICSPSHTHAEIATEVIESGKARAIILEKPIDADLAKARSLVEKIKSSGIPTIVNYSRRFDGKFKKIKAIIDSGELGSITRAVIHYSGGSLNNGSHFIDLLSYLFGELKIDRVAYPHPSDDADPSADIFGQLQNQAPFTLFGNPAENYFMAEGEFLFEKGSIRLEDSMTQMSIHTAEPSTLAEGYQALVAKESIQGTANPTFHAIEEMVARLDGQEGTLSCTAEDALRTLELCQEIHEYRQS